MLDITFEWCEPFRSDRARYYGLNDATGLTKISGMVPPKYPNATYIFDMSKYDKRFRQSISGRNNFYRS